MIEHRNVLNYLHNCTEVLGICPNDTVYGLASVTFDISVMELICSLLIGARLVLEHDVYNMEALAARIRDERVSVLQMTPSRLHAYLEKNSILTLSGVRIMLVGLVVGVVLLYHFSSMKDGRLVGMFFPFFKTFWLDLSFAGGVFFVFFAVLVITSTSNAVNLTDGLDGLATGSILMVGLAYAIITYVVGRVDFSSYLGIPYIRDASEIEVRVGNFVRAAP